MTSLSPPDFRPVQLLGSTHEEKLDEENRYESIRGKNDKENWLTSRRNFSFGLKTIRESATRTFDTMKERLDNFSQKLKRKSTRRRFRLQQSPYTPTPRRLDNRTPVKMYSPFAIETPESCEDSVQQFGRRGLYTPRKCDFESPNGKFGEDLRNFSRGSNRFQQLARNIIKRKGVKVLNENNEQCDKN